MWHIYKKYTLLIFWKENARKRGFMMDFKRLVNQRCAGIYKNATKIY